MIVCIQESRPRPATLRPPPPPPPSTSQAPLSSLQLSSTLRLPPGKQWGFRACVLPGSTFWPGLPYKGSVVFSLQEGLLLG